MFPGWFVDWVGLTVVIRLVSIEVDCNIPYSVCERCYKSIVMCTILAINTASRRTMGTGRYRAHSSNEVCHRTRYRGDHQLGTLSSSLGDGVGTNIYLCGVGLVRTGQPVVTIL